MNSRQYILISGLLFCLVALAHLLRIIYSLQIQVEAYSVPMFASWVGLIVPGALALWALRIVRGDESG